MRFSPPLLALRSETVSAWDLCMMVPHGLVNVGNETAKVVGFFSESEVIATFKEPAQPFGAAVLNQGAPPARAAASPLINVSELRHISFSHFESDECGSLNELLAAAPSQARVEKPV